MSKNVIWWIGVINPQLNEKYGNYEYFDYSKNTWKHFCDRFDCEFVEFSEPVESDMFKFRINWQKTLFVFDELERRGIDYDQICLVDSSFMYKWDAPNFFELTDNRFTAWRDTDNLRWIYDSIKGYKDFFDGFEFDTSKYVNSGFIIFNKKHREFFQSFKKLYYDNVDRLVELQDKIVIKGTEQTPFNYWLQVNEVDVNIDLPIPFKLTHMHRKELFSYNWQLDEDKTPFFIKYGYNWCFNGIPKDQRTHVMKQTWDLVKHNYDKSVIKYNKILDEVDHKDTAKYTTSRKFKKDVLDEFYNDKFKDATLLELGTSQGQSTRMLSYIFKNVYTVEWDDWNIEQARKRCEGRDNITFIKADLYGEDWNFPTPDVVFIDAGHTYENVISDIENCIKYFDNPIFIFDDYGLPPGEVKRAITDKVKEGKLRIDKFIGEKPEDLVHASGTKFFDMEGCMCNVK